MRSLIFPKRPSAPAVLILVLLALLTLAAGCRRSAGTSGGEDATLTLEVQPDPPTVGPSTLVLTLTGSDGEPIEGAALSVKGDMNHAGMVPVLGEAETGPDGVAEIPFEWTMGGDWIVTVDDASPGGDAFTRRFDLSVDS